MSLLGSIVDKIFHHPQATTPASPGAPAASPSPAQTKTAQPQTSSPSSKTGPTGASAAGQPVDVEAVLSSLAAQHGGGGNWRTSIVDLLKLLDLDSSLAARKQLANELNIHAGADGSAEENIALHRGVMQKLAENGGKVPDSLKH